MKLKSIISLLLCLLMLAALLVGCGNEGDKDTSSTESKADNSNQGDQTSEADLSAGESSQEDRYTDADGKYSTKNLPPYDDTWREYGEFRVLVTSQEGQGTYFSEEIEPLYTTTDSVILDGVTKRNDWVYEVYDITVKAVAVNDCLQAIRDEISGSLDTFDAAMPFMSTAAVLAQEGKLYDLNEYSDIIDLDAPWWDANATAAVSIGDKVFFTAGDMSLMHKIVSSGIAFNKQLMNDHFSGYDIYQEVRDGNWTLDRLYSMCKQITGTLEDDGVQDEKDLWGIVDTGPSFFYGCGEQLVTKDSSNNPVLALGETTRSVDVTQYVLGLCAEKKTWYATVDDWTDRTKNVWDTCVEVFGNGRSLFMAVHFSAIKKLRQYDVEYGIVPAAKYNEDQDRYYNKCSANYANGICIPVSVKDPDFSAYMLEVMSIGGKNNIANTYYNVVLKNKDFRDEDSEEMLDIIFNSIVYDPAIIYTKIGIHNILADLIKQNSTDFYSTLDTNRESYEKAIEEIITDYEEQ